MKTYQTKMLRIKAIQVKINFDEVQIFLKSCGIEDCTLTVLSGTIKFQSGPEKTTLRVAEIYDWIVYDGLNVVVFSNEVFNLIFREEKI